MKIAEIRERSPEELKNLEDDLRRQLWKAKFDNHTNQLDDTSKIQKLRRDIAKIRSVTSERARKQEK